MRTTLRYLSLFLVVCTALSAMEARAWCGGRAGESAGSTTGAGCLKTASEDGHLLATWVDRATHLGSSEYDTQSEAWGVVRYEAYSGPTDVIAAKERVRVLIVQ